VLTNAPKAPARGAPARAASPRVAHREVGEDLAVDFDLGGLETGDETRVRDVVLTARGVDAHDPEPTELTLAGASVAERVVAGVHDLLVGLAEAPAARAAVSLGPREDLAATLLAVDGSLDPGHDVDSWSGIAR
jgi:hypothetical protein